MDQSQDSTRSSQACLYDENYFRSHLGPEPYDRSNLDLLNFFAVVADEIIRSLRPQRVLDAGCAMGFLVEAFWDRGVQAWGIDISDYAISKVRRDMAPYCRVASLLDRIAGSYDVVTCIEVLEHLSEADSVVAIRHLAEVTDAILFSSSPSDLIEPTHINVHQPLWWLEQFQEAGFGPDLTYDASYITPHAFLLRRMHKPFEREVLRLFAELTRFKRAHCEQNRVKGESQLQTQNSVEARIQGVRDGVEARIQGVRDGVEAEVQRVQDAVKAEIQSVQKSIEAQVTELAELRQDMSSLMDRHLVLLREMERAAGGGSMGSVSPDINGIRDEVQGLRADVETARADAHYTTSKTDALASSVHSLQQRLDEILQSRIWRTLTRAGGFLLRLRGGS